MDFMPRGDRGVAEKMALLVIKGRSSKVSAATAVLCMTSPPNLENVFVSQSSPLPAARSTIVHYDPCRATARRRTQRRRPLFRKAGMSCGRAAARTAARAYTV